MNYLLGEPAEATLLFVYVVVMYFTARLKLEAHRALVQGSWLQRGSPATEAGGYAFVKLCIAGFIASKLALPGVTDIADPQVVSVPGLAVSAVLVADMIFMAMPHDRLWPWEKLLRPNDAARLGEHNRQQRLEAERNIAAPSGQTRWEEAMVQEQRRVEEEREAGRPPTDVELKEYSDFMRAWEDAGQKGIRVHFEPRFLHRMQAIRDRIEWAEGQSKPQPTGGANQNPP